MVPVENQHEFAALIAPELVRDEAFEGGGHGPEADAPERTMNLMRDFIAPEKTA